MQLRENSIIDAETSFDEIKGMCDLAIEDAGVCIRWDSSDLKYYIRAIERELLNLKKIAEGGCL